VKDDKKPEHPVAAVLRRQAAMHDKECPANALFKEFADAIDVREEENKATGAGPAQVATERYRKNFDTIFGKKQVVGQA
jgi:hypothetical protein